MVADDVVVVLEVVEHLLVVALAVPGLEAILDFDRVAGPVEGRRLAQQRPAAAVEHAADDLVLGIVVGRAGVFVHVEAGVAADPLAEGAVVGIGQPLQVEDGQPFAVVQPVEHDGELFVVHAVAGERDLRRLGQRVLPQMSFPGLLVKLQHTVGAAQGVQDRPVLQFSMASSGPSSPPQRSTHSR